MKILFLHSGDRVPSARFRILPFAARFREHGHQVKVAASFPQKYDFFPWLGFRPSQLLKKLVRWWHLLQGRWRRFDVAIIDRELFDHPAWDWEEKLRKLVPVFVLDVDDAVFLRYPEKFDRLVHMSDLVVAGNSFLFERISPANPRTMIVPTCIEMQSYPAKEAASSSLDRPPVIGWMGTTANLNYLKLIAEPLRKLAARCQFELRLIAPESTPLREIDLNGVTVKFIPWSGATEVDELRQLDAGLMPLFAEDEWNKYKCGLKLLQYMAVGIPGVASPVGVNTEIVEHGVDGFLPESQADWEQCLLELIENPQLRETMGQKARLKVQEQYSVEVHYPRLETALQETLQRVRSGGKTSGD